MEHVYPWQQLSNDIAFADALTEDSELQMATELSLAIQTGTVQCWKKNGDPIRGTVPFEKLRRLAPHLTVSEGDAWLKRNGYLHKWEPVESVMQPAPALVSDPLVIVNRIQANQQTWRDVVWVYVVQVFSDGQYTTAKALYAALEKKIGTASSPFEKGIGSNRSCLVVRDISKSVSLKTIQNHWADIKLAGK